ncbi:hypothetical protein KCU67_g106, partial [Aureobasidium melanogenum]
LYIPQSDYVVVEPVSDELAVCRYLFFLVSPCNALRSRLVSVLHSLILWSHDTDSSSRLSGVNATAPVQLQWFTSANRDSPVLGYHNLTTKSVPAEATTRPFREDATVRKGSSWVSVVSEDLCAAAFQVLMVLSNLIYRFRVAARIVQSDEADAKAISLPSGEKIAIVTSSESSLSVTSRFRFFTPYSMTVLSSDTLEHDPPACISHNLTILSLDAEASNAGYWLVVVLSTKAQARTVDQKLDLCSNEATIYTPVVEHTTLTRVNMSTNNTAILEHFDPSHTERSSLFVQSSLSLALALLSRDLSLGP